MQPNKKYMNAIKRAQLMNFGALALILLLALFVRSYHISDIPSGIYPDEAVNAADATYAHRTGDYLLFYENNYGREGLFINLQALALKTFGNTMPALKLWSIVFGTLTVWGMYLLAGELFRRRIAGLIAAFITATSFWAINFSRIGFRAIMTSLILSFSFYFFFRGLRTRKFTDFLWGGLFFGLGLHTYVAFRVAPLILILLLPALILSYESFLRRYWKHGLIFVFGAFVSAAPMLYHFFISHPGDFASRSSAVSIFSPEVNQGDLFGTLSKTVTLSLIKYNFWGDQNWRHNYPPYPILDPIVGALFLAGLLYVVWQIGILLGRRLMHKDRDLRLVRDVFLLGSFFVMLMPEFLTHEGLPHALRSIGTQVPVFLMATLPALWIAKRGIAKRHTSRAAHLLIIAVLLVTSASINITKYFVYFANSPSQMNSFALNERNIAEYLLALPEETHKYVVSNDRSRIVGNHLPINAQPIVFLTDGKIKDLTWLIPDADATISRHDSVIAFISRDDQVIANILARSPEAKVMEIDLRPGTQSAFTIVRLP
jgi:4-amino-4-deoxy-L-arabinose transferase-like glycosyltransferase